MKKFSKGSLRRVILLLIFAIAFLFVGCGKTQTEEVSMEEMGTEAETVKPGEEETKAETAKPEGEEIRPESAKPEEGDETKQTAEETKNAPDGDNVLAGESAADAEVDFKAVKEENPDAFAWIYIPGTEIDCPVLQSGVSDDFYENHNARGEESAKGAVYTEMANLRDMTDFNTVIHGKEGGAGNFDNLYRYADSDFFDANEEIYLYLDGNVLVYEIFAAFERENNSLIRKYNFTSAEGCNEFLKELYTREMGKQIREGWEGLTPNHFLITLTVKTDETSGRQFVVIAALVNDAAGTINREIFK